MFSGKYFGNLLNDLLKYDNEIFFHITNIWYCNEKGDVRLHVILHIRTFYESKNDMYMYIKSRIWRK